MSDQSIRIPAGIRALSVESLAALIGAMSETKHTKLVTTIEAILRGEIDRRSNPAESEPEWPTIDVSGWTLDELFRAIRDCLGTVSVLPEPEARAFIRTIGFICWSEFRHRVGSDVLPYSEPSTN